MNTIVILSLILSLLIGFFIWKNISNRKKKNEEIKKQNLINSQRIEKLKKEKAREDLELLLQKKVECDDGKIRIYSENMYGILSDFPIIGSSTTESYISMEFGSNSTVFEEAKEIVVDSNDLIKMEEAYELRSTQEFDHKIKVDNWFSPIGVSLNFKDILNSKQNWENHRQNYTKKYRELLNRMRFSKSKPRIIKLLKINDYLFLSSSFIPFNGKIDEVKYINGKKVEDGVREKEETIKKAEEVADQYKIDEDLPETLEIIPGLPKMYKRDMTGLMAYFKEMTNMERIFNELTGAIRNGYTVEKYLKDANLMDDPEIREIATRGFNDVAGFLKDMLEINENPELRKDYDACMEAVEILKGLK